MEIYFQIQVSEGYWSRIMRKSHYRYVWRGKPVRCGDCGTVFDNGAFRRCPTCGCKWGKTGYYKVVVPPALVL